MLTLGSAHGPERRQEDQGLAAQLLQLRPALCACAAHVAAGRFDDANRCVDRIMGLASLGDGPLQRLSKIFVGGLVRRQLGTTINRALINPSTPYSVRTARSSFVKLLPFLKVAYVAINRVILDAMENEKFVHIIDLSGPAAHPWQWLKLMRAFRRRPYGAPNLCITVVHEDGEFLADTSARLRAEADSMDMAFTFHGFLGRLETLDLGNLHESLAIKSGYAHAFSCALQMRRLLRLPVMDAAAVQQLHLPGAAASSFVHYAHHHHHEMNLVPDDYPSPTTSLSPFTATPSPPQHQHLVVPSPLTQFQLAVRAVSPKVVAIMEQEVMASHNNGQDFPARFRDALHYYAALFDALQDSSGGALLGGGDECRRRQTQEEEERAQVEQVVLGEEIRDVLVRDVMVAEPLRRWAARMVGAGFGAVPLSYVAKMEADEVLRKYRLRGYENRAHEKCLLLCWNGRPLYAVSAWRPWSCSQGSAFSVSSQQQQRMVVPGQMTPTWTWPRQHAAKVHNFTY
ncbi:hypothetical protein PR202_gb16467 [Eleusine coracana subsp. coracana]|uniref:Scarecrow-like protein 3 n=1 Tax=Eleusine coracana subsp. coracana TaxID=191504 RepID=A0AAV5F0J3_ELECO|nr:hypothetical protein QOZ80_9BG0697850 [Eleusine coracana subsp. coracana]GJN28356.1 hypothetical protein PR202_gb16467 [Eleusine coracana subsp. coracana]